MKKSIYFLSTGNSCRSQMAEGWAKKYLGEEWEVNSAGIEAHGLNPKTVKAMEEVGIDISNQTSDIIDPKILNNADLVVTLCGDAAAKCPITPPSVKREHRGFDDPAKAQGTDEEKWVVFQHVRDQIGERIECKTAMFFSSCGLYFPMLPKSIRKGSFPWALNLTRWDV